MSRILHTYLKIKDFILNQLDPVLLLFVLLITNYRFSFKIAALVIVYIIRPNFKFKRSGLHLFYIGIIVLGLINLLFLSHDLSYQHIMMVLTGCLIWMACALTLHQVQIAIEQNSVLKIINTLKVLVVINFIISVIEFIQVMIITKTINPYNEESAPPYGISSGDLIGGVFGEMHLVNTTISAMMLLFFLNRRNFTFGLLSLLPFLLTGSNLGTLILLGVLLYISITDKIKLNKYYSLCCVAIIFVFYIKITPKNFNYLEITLQKVTSQLTHKTIKINNKEKDNAKKLAESQYKNKLINQFLSTKYESPKQLKKNTTSNIIEKQELIAQKEKQDNLNYVWYRKDSLQKVKSVNEKFKNSKIFNFNETSGKLISFQQTQQYLLSDWKHFLFGAGIGSFSSRLAFIGSGIVLDSRLLMRACQYENPLFTENHKAIFKYLLFLDDEYHSITNLPFCWYNELLGEYGVIGLCVFIVCYLGFIVKRFKFLSYGKLLLITILAFFLFDYWFQRLSVMVIFELLILLDIKLTSDKEDNSL